MSIDIRGRLTVAKMQCRASYERGLGRGIWQRILARLDDTDGLSTDEIVELTHLPILRDAMGDDEHWFLHVGQVAGECPADVPRGERTSWVISELYRRGAEC